jgi:hypothetical protein
LRALSTATRVASAAATASAATRRCSRRSRFSCGV